MSLCAVILCNNRGVHRFPTDEILKLQWIRATRIDIQRKIGWNLRKYSCVCSAHFTASDFKSRGKQRLLKRTAVPSIFPWTEMPSTSSCNIVEPRDGSSLYDTTFNPDNALKNYTRSDLPLTFVEEYPTLHIEMASENIDPLRISVNSSPSLGDGSLEVTIGNIEHHEERTTHYGINSNHNQISHCDKSVQTAKFNQSNLGSGNSNLVKSPFSVYRYKHSDKAIHFYTGLETFDKLIYVFYTLGNSSNLKYFYETNPNKLDSLEQFFITLIILRRHKEFEEISMLCLISVKEVADIFITWIRFMALQWKNLDLWVDRELIKSYMPMDFYDKYPMTRVILDATECPIKKPGLPLAQQITFSSYKNRNTIKFLIGIAPSGLITYISPSYGGSATDRQILERSNILQRFDYNDEIMVDKGLNVQDMVMAYGVKVNMPSFFKKGNQINSETLTKDRKVASKRVHVERVIGMLKTYKILKQPLNQTETILASDITFICAMLVNFRSNIVN